MKLQLLIVAALVACAYAQETHDVDAMVDEHVDRAIKTASDAIATTQKAIGDEKKACDDEIKASQAWMDSIDEKKLQAMRARRIRDKKNLLVAVKERITVMTDYLAKLKLARGKLVSVIKHVNHIYGTAYDEAISAQKESAKIMMLLGLSIGHTYNPGSEFSKIKLPREDKEDEGADESADAAKLESNNNITSNNITSNDITSNFPESRTTDMYKEAASGTDFNSGTDLFARQNAHEKLHPSIVSGKPRPYVKGMEARGVSSNVSMGWNLESKPTGSTKASSISNIVQQQKNTNTLHFPCNDFRYFLTLFSKFFSSFPHGTFSLSVSY